MKGTTWHQFCYIICLVGLILQPSAMSTPKIDRTLREKILLSMEGQQRRSPGLMQVEIRACTVIPRDYHQQLQHQHCEETENETCS